MKVIIFRELEEKIRSMMQDRKDPIEVRPDQNNEEITPESHLDKKKIEKMEKEIEEQALIIEKLKAF